jgi:hypothetical protein
VRSTAGRDVLESASHSGPGVRDAGRPDTIEPPNSETPLMRAPQPGSSGPSEASQPPDADALPVPEKFLVVSQGAEYHGLPAVSITLWKININFGPADTNTYPLPDDTDTVVEIELEA